MGAGSGTTASTAGGVPLEGTQRAVTEKLSGALVGGVVGNYDYRKKDARNETAKAYTRQPATELVLRIQKIAAIPQIVNAGDSVELRLTYALLTPDPNGELRIAETRTIRHNGLPVGEMKVTVVRNSGTYVSAIALKLPSAAPKGAYNFIAGVQGGDITDLAETSFYVQ